MFSRKFIPSFLRNPTIALQEVPPSLPRKFPCRFAGYFPPIAFQEIPPLLPGKFPCCLLESSIAFYDFSLWFTGFYCFLGNLAMTIAPWEARNYFPRNFILPVQEISLLISSNSSFAFWEISPLGNITFLRNVTSAFQEVPWYFRKFPPCFLGTFLL